MRTCVLLIERHARRVNRGGSPRPSGARMTCCSFLATPSCSAANDTGGIHRPSSAPAVARGASVKASARDLLVRGVGEEELVDGVELVEEIEAPLVDEVMEHADRVMAS